MENVILKALKERRSIRKYQKKQITDEELQAVLEAGTFAPTAYGAQDPFIVAVQNQEIINQLVKMNALVRGKDGNPYYDAPTIVLVFASKSASNNFRDGSLVLGNMMNAAHAINLGSCWINREFEMFSTPEGIELMKKFNLPEGLIGIGAISLGYADCENPKPIERKKDYIRIIK